MTEQQVRHGFGYSIIQPLKKTTTQKQHNKTSLDHMGSHRKKCETWTDAIRFVDVSEGSSSSVLKMLRLSERRKQDKKNRYH